MLLQDSNGDLCTCWNAMNNMLILQHKEIKASFERSITVVEHKHNIPFYKHLRGFVSRSAISRIAEELERVNYVGVDSSTCGCTIRSTYGLPCACELGRYRMMHVSIPLEAIHTHWLKLHCGDQEVGESDAELTLAPAIDALLSRFDGLDRARKIVLRTKLFELAFPDTTSLCPPPEKVKTKGAPKKGATSKLDKSTRRDPSYFEHVDAMLSSYENTPTRPASRASLTRTPLKTDMKYLHQFPGGIRPYIDNIVNVDADGNCGYRAIAALLGKGEGSWAIVRDDCFRELTKCQHIYAKLFNGVDRVHELKNSVLVNGVAGVDKWMTMPDMGYVIASRYNVVLIFLASTGSVTIFPLRGRPSPSLSSHRIITIGLVHNCHFVQVFLKADSPIPPTDLRWSSHCDVESRSWETTYIGRMQLFSSLLPKRNHVEPHYVDLSAD